MKRIWMLMLLCTTLLCGCGAQQVEAKEVSEFVYNVSTGDTVTLLFQTDDKVTADVDGNVTKLGTGGDSCGSIEFADTSDVLQYVDGNVPTVLANNPYYRFASTYQYVSAIVLNETTSIVITSKTGLERIEDLMSQCEIFVY